MSSLNQSVKQARANEGRLVEEQAAELRDIKLPRALRPALLAPDMGEHLARLLDDLHRPLRSYIDACGSDPLVFRELVDLNGANRGLSRAKQSALYKLSAGELIESCLERMRAGLADARQDGLDSRGWLTFCNQIGDLAEAIQEWPRLGKVSGTAKRAVKNLAAWVQHESAVESAAEYQLLGWEGLHSSDAAALQDTTRWRNGTSAERIFDFLVGLDDKQTSFLRYSASLLAALKDQLPANGRERLADLIRSCFVEQDGRGGLVSSAGGVEDHTKRYLLLALSKAQSAEYLALLKSLSHEPQLEPGWRRAAQQILERSN